MKKLALIIAVFGASIAFSACGDGDINSVIRDYCYYSDKCGKGPVDEHKYDKCVNDLERRYRDNPECEWVFQNLYYCGMAKDCGRWEDPRCGADRSCIDSFYWSKDCHDEEKAVRECTDKPAPKR